MSEITTSAPDKLALEEPQLTAPARKTAFKLSILMPVFNERRTLRTIFDRVLAAPLPIPFEIIAVDDCSTDGSFQILTELAAADSRIKVYRQEKNSGKGAAIHAAIARMDGDIAIIQDADLEYDPNDIARLIEPIISGKAEAVFGSRFAGSECRRVLYFWHSLANKFLAQLTNVLCDLNLTDMETCYKAIKADILRMTPLKCKRFGIEPELTVRLAQWGARIYEVPISYNGRTYAEGKKITWKDGFDALWVLFNTTVLDRRFTTHDGYYVLTAIRGNGLNKWMFEQFKKFVGKRVLEAGCGIGNLTELMLDVDSLWCVDVDPLYVEMISRRFGHLENFNVTQMDLAESSAYNKLENEKLDTIICLNVLEHIEDDETVLKNFYRSLAPGGHAIVLVPQHPSLYSAVDETVGHFRRYTAEELKAKLEKAGFEVAGMQNFNKLGVPGWWYNKLRKRKHLTPHQMWLFNQLLFVAKAVEKMPFAPGLSVIGIGKKPG